MIHTLDAYFNACVLSDLAWECLDNVVAIHDSWIVPSFHYYVDQPGGCLGHELIDKAIYHASQDWIGPWDWGMQNGVHRSIASGGQLGIVYDWFVTALAGSPYETFAIGVRDRWRQRVAEGRWPKFTAS